MEARRRWLAAGHRRGVLALLLVVALPLGAAATRQLAPPGSSPATGQAQVVTQGIDELPTGRVVWRLVERTAPARGEARASRRVLGFIFASDEPVLLTDVTPDGNLDVARLASGEAFLVRDGTRQIRASLTDTATTYLALEIVPARDANDVGSARLLYTSPAFAPPAGARDLDLVRNVLAVGEEGLIPDSGARVLILATDGAIDVLPAGGKTRRLDAGESTLLSGEIAIKAVKPRVQSAKLSPFAALTAPLAQVQPGGAAYVVAVIGPEIPPPPTPTATPTATPLPTATATPVPPTEEPATAEPTAEPTAEATAEPTTEPTPAPTATPTAPDFDGDGLSDADERKIGTSPRLPDTDGDGLGDGTEVLQIGTDPLARDTDRDTLGDGDEVNVHGTNPLDLDTDDDQWSDGREVAAGTDPLDPADHP